MSQKFINAVKHKTAQQDTTRSHVQFATVVSYDPSTGCAKVSLQPENIQTGWIPVNYPSVSAGGGLISPPSNGQQVLIGFEGGQSSSGVVLGGSYSGQSLPPTINGNAVQSGELALVSGVSGGSFLYIQQNGNISVSSTTQMVHAISGGQTITLTFSTDGLTAVVGGTTWDVSVDFH